MAADSYRRSSRAAEYLEVTDFSAMAVVTQVPDGSPLVLKDSSYLVYSHVPDCTSPWLTPDQIAQLVASDTGLLAETVIADVQEFLKMLLLHGILEIRN